MSQLKKSLQGLPQEIVQQILNTCGPVEKKLHSIREIKKEYSRIEKALYEYNSAIIKVRINFINEYHNSSYVTCDIDDREINIYLDNLLRNFPASIAQFRMFLLKIYSSVLSESFQVLCFQLLKMQYNELVLPIKELPKERIKFYYNCDCNKIEVNAKIHRQYKSKECTRKCIKCNKKYKYAGKKKFLPDFIVLKENRWNVGPEGLFYVAYDNFTKEEICKKENATELKSFLSENYPKKTYIF